MQGSFVNKPNNVPGINERVPAGYGHLDRHPARSCIGDPMVCWSAGLAVRTGIRCHGVDSRRSERSTCSQGIGACIAILHRLANRIRVPSSIDRFRNVPLVTWVGVVGRTNCRLCHWPLSNSLHIQCQALQSCSRIGNGTAVCKVKERFREAFLRLFDAITTILTPQHPNRQGVASTMPRLLFFSHGGTLRRCLGRSTQFACPPASPHPLLSLAPRRSSCRLDR